MKRAWIALFASVLAVLTMVRAAAADQPKRVVVAELSGDSGGEVRRGLLQALLGHSELRVISLDHAKKLADAAGVEIADRAGAVALGQKLGVAAVVEGEVKSAGGSFSAKIRVRASKDGEVTEAHQFRADSAGALAKKLAASAWTQISPGLLDTKSPNQGGTKVAVLPFTGTKSTAVRSWVQKALKRKKGLSVLSDKQVKAANLSDDSKGSELVAAAEALEASAFVRGKVAIAGKDASLDLEVANGADGESLSQLTLEGAGLAGLKRSIDRELAKKLDGPLSSARAPEPPEEKLGAESATSDEPEGAGEDGEEAPAEKAAAESGPSGRPSPLEVGGGLRAASRNFRYTDDLFDRLRAYKLGLSPSGFLWVRWYPVAHFDAGPLAHLGLTAGYEQGFALESESATGEKFDTSSREWFAGLRYRIPVAPHEVGVQVTYGSHSFQVDDDPVFPLVPDVKYQYIRLGADGRVRVSRVVIGAHVGYRLVNDAGDIQSDRWFPHASVGGVDAGLQAGYEIVDGLDLVAGFDFRRYFYSMNPEPGDANIAGGALDEYLAGWAGFAYRLPGGS